MLRTNRSVEIGKDPKGFPKGLAGASAPRR